MRSIKAAAMLVVPSLAASVTLWLFARRAIALASLGGELPFGCKLSLALWNSYVRFAPFLAIGMAAVVLILVGALGAPTLQGERKGLAAWLVLGLSESAVLAAVAGALVAWQDRAPALAKDSLEWLFGLLPLVTLASVSWLAAGVAAVRVQWRLELLGSRVRAWHLGVLVALLSILGPPVLALSFWVWWQSGDGGQNA